MPSYEYRCTKCGESKSLTISIKQDAPEHDTCPACGKTMIRQYGLAAVSFKGSGFASNDKR